MGGRLRTGSATLVALALALAGAPAIAAEPGDPAPRVTRDRDGSVDYTDPALAEKNVERVRGRLRVVVVDGTGRDGHGSRREHALEVADGTVVPLDLEVARLEPGSTVLADVVTGPDLDAALAGEPQDPVAVESASIEPVAESTTVTPSGHRAYVAVIRNAGTPDAASTIEQRVDSGLAWWATEAPDAITSFTRPAATAVYASAVASPCSASNAYALWDEAATRFPGVAFTPTSGNHLVVVVDDACAGWEGLGTVGSSIASGGEILMTDGPSTFTATLGHELGHNVGLEHANLECSCNGEYWDLYSPMALSVGGGSYGPPALDGEYRDQLGITASGEVETVSAAGTTTRTLQARGSASGLRSLRVVAPDGRVHWVEARLGGGRDATSFIGTQPAYTWAGPPARGYPRGVTVSTDVVGSGTPSLLRPRPDGTTLRGARTAGQTFTDGDVTIAVDTVGTTSATVSVTIAGEPTPGEPTPDELEPGVPTVSGTAAVGATLTRGTGTWTSGATLTTQWLVDGVAVTGATGATFVPRPADVGKVVSVRVTGAMTGATDRSATSAPTAPVALGSFTGPAPTVSGTPKVGVALTSAVGSWPAGTTVARQWLVGGVAVSGQTGSSFTPAAAHKGKTVALKVTAKRSGYRSVVRTSATTAAVAAGTLRWVTPTISGKRKVGYTLTAIRGTWTSGTSYSYQWYAGTTALRGATGKTLRLTTAHRGKKIRVRVIGRKAGYTSVAKYSAYTAAIAR